MEGCRILLQGLESLSEMEEIDLSEHNKMINIRVALCFGQKVVHLN